MLIDTVVGGVVVVVVLLIVLVLVVVRRKLVGPGLVGAQLAVIKLHQPVRPSVRH